MGFAPRTKGSKFKDVNLEHFFGYKNTVPEYLSLIRTEDYFHMLEEIEPSDLLQGIYLAIDAPPKGAYKQMQVYRNLLMRAALKVMLLEDVFHSATMELDRLTNNVGERGGKRWEPEEDEALIEMASRDDITIIDLSQEFGRTPGAIQSRLTKLVGIKKLSVEVAGRFVGTIDGELIEGEISGTVSKTRPN